MDLIWYSLLRLTNLLIHNLWVILVRKNVKVDEGRKMKGREGGGREKQLEKRMLMEMLKVHQGQGSIWTT